MKHKTKSFLSSARFKVILVFIILGLYIFVPGVHQSVNNVTYMLSVFNVEMIKTYILSYGIWAPIISFILMIFQSVAAPLPAFLITFANASLFGWIKGAALSWVSSMAGAILCFYLSRYFGRAFVIKITSKSALESVDGFFEKYGKHAILIARLLPFISFDVISYSAGLTNISFWSFVIATGLGQLPATLIYSYVGGMLSGGTKLFVFGLLTLFALSILILLIKKMWNNKNSSD